MKADFFKSWVKHMKSTLDTLLLLFLLFPLNAICVAPAEELDWNDLLPADYRPEKVLEKFSDISQLKDDDPRAKKILEDLKEYWNEAPIVDSLDGKRVKLPGFVVPLEGDGNVVIEFLLVPYFGACIHVPPPPSNQIVYVRVSKGAERKLRSFDTVWVTGIMSAKPLTSILATAGYQIKAEEVTLYHK
jgi:hypothetical protein